MVDSDGFIVGFNLKYDLHWLKRYGVDVSRCHIWDCQLFEFINKNQSTPFPSLNDVAAYYGVGVKDDEVAKYWEAGIDTDRIPPEVLHKYLRGDLDLTYQVYLAQREVFKTYSLQRQNLIKLHMHDLMVLKEMEFNGTKIDLEGLDKAARLSQTELQQTEDSLRRWTGDFKHFNFDSVDHVSCLLYGGTVSVDVAEPYEHTYLSGPRAGTTVTRNKWSVETRTYPRLVEPLEKSELKKEGYWSTDEKWLGKLKNKREVKELVTLLLKRSELEKLIGTYYIGLPKLLETMDWKESLLHGQLNQCVAVTGRLSSSKPNMQNFDKGVNQYVVTRF